MLNLKKFQAPNLFLLLCFGLALASPVHAQRFVKVVNTIDDLVRLNPNDVHTNVFVADADRGGLFSKAVRATTNSGTMFMSTNASWQWNRQWSGEVDVKWFGAALDGSDDTAEIQEAIDWANQGAVYIPKGGGNIGLGTPLTVPANRTLTFEKGAVLYPRAAYTSNQVVIVTGTNVTFKNIQINGANLTGPAAYSTPDAADGVGVYLRGLGGTHLSAIKFEDGRIVNIPGIGILGYYIDGLTIDGLTTAYCPINTAQAPPGAIYLNTCTEVDIVRTTVYVPSMKGVNISNSSKVRVSKSQFIDGLSKAQAAIYLSNTSLANVTENYIEDFFGIKLTETVTGQTHDIQVSENIMDLSNGGTAGLSSSAAGILVQGGWNIGITHNDIYEAPDDGIQVSYDPTGSGANNIQIEDNFIYRSAVAVSGQEGIQIVSDGMFPVTNIKAKDNDIVNPSIGIRVRFATNAVYSDLELSNNKINGALSYGISLLGQNSKVNNNEIDNAGTYGILVEGLNGATREGIIEASGNIIKDNSPATSRGIVVADSTYARLLKMNDNYVDGATVAYDFSEADVGYFEAIGNYSTNGVSGTQFQITGKTGVSLRLYVERNELPSKTLTLSTTTDMTGWLDNNNATVAGLPSTVNRIFIGNSSSINLNHEYNNVGVGVAAWPTDNSIPFYIKRDRAGVSQLWMRNATAGGGIETIYNSDDSSARLGAYSSTYSTARYQNGAVLGINSDSDKIVIDAPNTGNTVNFFVGDTSMGAQVDETSLNLANDYRLQWSQSTSADGTEAASITSSTGSPETVITANPGSIYLRYNGSAGSQVYVKESGTGNTGWAALVATGGSSLMPTGTVIAYAGSATPTGYLACDGSAVSRTTYAALFTAISTTWGVGDGVTTFNVPDLRGRQLIGSGTGAGLTARTLGTQNIGAETVTLDTLNMPLLEPNSTILPAQAGATNPYKLHASQWDGGPGVPYSMDGSDAVNPRGGSEGSPPAQTAVDTLDPSGVVNFIIKI